LSDETKRTAWIDKVRKGFVHHSEANKGYYRIVLEMLWPAGTSIPGPKVSKEELDKAVERSRGGDRYRDLARRIREMQGEEGLIGLERTGSGRHTYYRLASLELAPKRIPREGISEVEWRIVLKRNGNRCAVCERTENEMRLDPDHKVPRLRGGGDELSNQQPLCKECNNFKSTMCRDCNLDCQRCPWAFPERFAQIKLTQEHIEKVRGVAKRKGRTPSETLAEIVSSGLLNIDN